MSKDKDEIKAGAQGPKRKLNKENLRKLRILFSYILPYKWLFFTGLLVLMVNSVMFLVFPVLPGKLIDVAQGRPYLMFDSINSIVLTLAAAVVLQALFSFIRIYLFSIVGEKSSAGLRKDLYKKLLQLPMKFYDGTRTGEVMSRISSDVSFLQSVYTTTVAELLRQIITLIGSIVVISWLAPQVTLVMLAVLPVVVILGASFGKLIRKYARKAQDALAETNVVVEETLQGIYSVKSFTGERFEFNRYSKSLARSIKYGIQSGKYRAAFFSFTVPSVFAAYVLVMWFGARQIESGQLEPGSFISVILVMGFVGGSIAGLGELFGQIQRAVGSSERILEILAEESEDGLFEEDTHEPLVGTISFENVDFVYPTRTDVSVLDGLSIEIGKGQQIALVGKSGAGKSTVVQVLQKLYDIQAGDIKVDGMSIKEIGLKRLRNNIGIVPQEIILFGGSIRENLLYGKPDATDEEIFEALKKANAADFVEHFPEGLETLVGDRGVKLSGGQRQRIAIARAILKNPSILILDEATSSLDAESEHLVQQALDNLMVGRTTLIIAHRLTTIRAADKILILQGGKIVESGKHEELLQIPNGHYSKLVRLQTEGVDIA
mgnify:CR=1 FL=1